MKVVWAYGQDRRPTDRTFQFFNCQKTSSFSKCTKFGSLNILGARYLETKFECILITNVGIGMGPTDRTDFLPKMTG
jgi:hypothetical protein